VGVEFGGEETTVVREDTQISGSNER
jgi:hypothetical protein